MNIIQFESSYGLIAVNEKGEVIKKESDLSGYLLNIEKIDIEEIDHYHKLNEFSCCEGGDVLDVGYWDKKGKYHKPCRKWRTQTFHNGGFSNKKVREVIKTSFDWINVNRKIL